MQSKSSNNNIVILFLVSPRLRVFRHLVLLISILSISASFIWCDEDMTTFQKYGGLFLLTVIFLGLSYLNVYILTPGLLLKNKWGPYFCSLAGLVALMMVTIIVFQIILGASHQSELSDPVILNLVRFVNLLSGSQVFLLLFVGASTFVVFKQWILDMQQSEGLKSVTLQTELKLLENQINPHFLFNVLNNANIKISKDPDIAIHIIGKMEEMLGYLMNDNEREKVSLKKEISFLSDYLELEKTRRSRFHYSVTHDGDIDNVEVPPLLLITFVENAVKHNQDIRSDSYVDISFKVFSDRLVFICINSIPQREPNKKKAGGIGLANVKRRLDLLYNGRYSLEQTKTDVSYSVQLKLKL